MGAGLDSFNFPFLVFFLLLNDIKKKFVQLNTRKDTFSQRMDFNGKLPFYYYYFTILPIIHLNTGLYKFQCRQ